MCGIHKVGASRALAGLALFSALAVGGCSDQKQSGEAIEDTAQAQAGRKASMEGMKNIMEQQKEQPKK